MSDGSSTAGRRIGLSEAIDDLRQELCEAQERGRDRDFGFDVEEIHLELAVEIQRQAGLDGKVSFTVLGSGVEIGGSGGAAKTTGHKVTLILRPGDGREPFRVSDRGSERPGSPAPAGDPDSGRPRR